MISTELVLSEKRTLDELYRKLKRVPCRPKGLEAFGYQCEAIVRMKENLHKQSGMGRGGNNSSSNWACVTSQEKKNEKNPHPGPRERTRRKRHPTAQARQREAKAEQKNKLNQETFMVFAVLQAVASPELASIAFSISELDFNSGSF